MCDCVFSGYRCDWKKLLQLDLIAFFFKYQMGSKNLETFTFEWFKAFLDFIQGF